MNFIFNHMLQALIVSRAEENHDFHFLSSKSVVHYFVAAKLISELVKLCRNSVDSTYVFTAILLTNLFLKGCAITLYSVKRSDFRCETFNQVTDCHARRNSMRVHDQIRSDSLDGEGHVFLFVGHSYSTFLTVAGGKLVTNLRNSD